MLLGEAYGKVRLSLFLQVLESLQGKFRPSLAGTAKNASLKDHTAAWMEQQIRDLHSACHVLDWPVLEVLLLAHRKAALLNTSYLVNHAKIRTKQRKMTKI